jgi:hypothetical protein
MGDANNAVVTTPSQTPSVPPVRMVPEVPGYVRAMDMVGDWIAACLLTYLVHINKLDGTLGAGLIVALFTGQTGLRGFAQSAVARAVGSTVPPSAGLGVFALSGLALWHALQASGGHVGYATVRTLRAVTLLALVGLLGALAWHGCTMAPPDGCTPGTHRCSADGTPQTCSQTQRWSSPANAQPCSASGAAIACCDVLNPLTGHTVSACLPVSQCPVALSDAGTDGG